MFVGTGQFGCAVRVDEEQGIVVLPEGGRPQVGHEQGYLLAQPFGLGVGQQVFGFGGKAHAKQCATLCLRAARDGGENVGVFGKLQGRWLAAAIFLDFVWSGVAAAPVGHGGGGDENTALGHVLLHGLQHVAGGLHINALHAIRRGQMYGPSDQRNVGTRLLPTVIAVNTNIVTDAPTSWQDLTDAQYAGKIAMPNPDVSGAAAYNAAVWLDNDRLGKTWLEALAKIMRGQVSYYSPKVTWRESWVRNSAAKAAELNKIGEIDTPNGPAPALAGDRNWLRNGVTQTQEGKSFRLEVEWLASDRGGWDRDIYTD